MLLLLLLVGMGGGEREGGVEGEGVFLKEEGGGSVGGWGRGELDLLLKYLLIFWQWREGEQKFYNIYI